jgi:glycosyltransferase involved in cell wall biosynthesis
MSPPRRERRLRIAQVAPLAESVPPQMYGGTERIVSHLTEELVRQGHRVTLYASGDSVTAAELVAITPRALRLDPEVIDPLAHHVRLIERVIADADRYDVVHFHMDHLQLGAMRRLRTPSVATMHGRMDLPDLAALYAVFADVPLVSISDEQRRPVPDLNWQATIYHGLPMDEIRATDRPGSYLAFLGRTSPEKGLDQAIAIARRSHQPLKIAAKIDPVDEEYFDSQIRPLLTGEIEFVGEIAEEQKDEFLGGASALLFPIDWPEPFGLVMIEAAARGTPVLAYPRGSVREVIEEGVTGMVVEDADAAVAALPQLLELPRAGVRRAVEDRFSLARMARDYVDVYERLMAAARREEPTSLAIVDDEQPTVTGDPVPVADLATMNGGKPPDEVPANG